MQQSFAEKTKTNNNDFHRITSLIYIIVGDRTDNVWSDETRNGSQRIRDTD